MGVLFDSWIINSNFKLKKMKNLTIESAKQFLKDNGYFVDNLWSVEDVKSKYECTDEQAQTVLGDILHGEWFMSEVNASIDITAEAYNLPKKKGVYFAISGYWKDDKSEFIEELVYSLEENEEEENDDIFFYEMTEENIKKHIELGENTWLEFVITSYEETTLN